MRDKKLLLFIDHLGSGGAQRQFVELATLLKNVGYDVTVLIVFEEYDFFKSILGDIKIIVGSKSNNYLKRLFCLVRIIKKQKPDVVISYLDTQNIIACVAKMMSGFKLIVSDRNTTQNLTLRDKFRYWLYQYSDFIVPNSYTQGEFIKKYKPQYLSKVHVITNVVDLKKFYPESKPSCNKTSHIISVGRFYEQKNYHGMVEVINILKGRGLNLHFDWYGGNQQSDYFKRINGKINEYRLNDVISIHQPVSNIRECYCKSDFFWLYSLFEGFPNVLCEAMACGIPVACSDVCDNSIIVEEPDNGQLLPIDSYVETADKIEKLLSLTFEDRAAIKANNVKKIELLCSKDSFVGAYINLIEA